MATRAATIRTSRLRSAARGLAECFSEHALLTYASAISFRAPDRTLTDDEVATLRGQLIDAVTTKHRAELRG